MSTVRDWIGDLKYRDVPCVFVQEVLSPEDIVSSFAINQVGLS